MIHQTALPPFGDDWPELAEQLGDLRYDALADFLLALSEKMKKDGDADLRRQRKKLATELYASADDLKAAGEAMARAWEICAPFMGDSQEGQ